MAGRPERHTIFQNWYYQYRDESYITRLSYARTALMLKIVTTPQRFHLEISYGYVFDFKTGVNPPRLFSFYCPPLVRLAKPLSSDPLRPSSSHDVSTGTSQSKSCSLPGS